MTERGPADEFEVVWRSGHVDRFRAHQVTHHGGEEWLGSSDTPRRVYFHGEVDGHWTLVLSALEDDLLSVRNVTRAPGELKP